MYKMMRKYKKWFSLFLTMLMLFTLVSPQLSKAASTNPITLAKWDMSDATNKFKVTSGTDANLDKTLSVNGASLNTAYVAGPSGYTVPYATNWVNNSSYWEVSLSTKGYQTITVSSKQYGSSTGPKDFKLQYSLDHTNWVDVQAVPSVAGNWTSGVLSNVALPSDTNDKNTIYVRWLVASNVSIGGATIGTGGTDRIADIVFTGQPTGAPTLEKTATPDTTKITYSSYSTVTGSAGAVAGNATVTLYYDDNSQAATTTAAADGSFTATIANPQSKATIYVTAQENGKDPSDKVAVNYTGAVPVVKTAAPNASKITYSSYTTVAGAAGAVAGNSTVNLYFDDNTVVGTATAAADGSFTVNFANPLSKSIINLTAQETGKDPSDKVAINYTSNTPTSVQPGDVVFSQLYVNGGNSGAFYKTKFFELYNNTNNDIDLTGWSIAYTSAATMSFGAGQALSGMIKAHGYFLVAGNTGTTGADLPVKPDVTISLNPSGSAGGALVLANKKTAVTGVDDPNAIDLLAYTNGTAVYKNPLYWGSPISDSTIGGGTIQRKTNISTNPASAYGMGNGWFTKDPSKDFILNKPSGSNYPEEMTVHNSSYMVSPDASKITFTRASGQTTVVGQPGAVPASSTVKAYFENNGALTTPKQATAAADGSFTLNFADSSQNTAVYLTHTDTAQPIALESVYTRIDLTGSKPAVTPLSDLHKNNKNGLPLTIGYKTTIEGVATTDNTPTGNLKTNFFVQDSIGAMNVINSLDPSTSVKAGNKYSITGQVVFTAGMTQFIPSAIKDLGPDTAPKAAQIAISSIGEANESSLVTFTGKVTNIPANGPDYDITVSDDSGINLTTVHLQGSLNGVELGSTYTFTGTVNQNKKASPFTSGYFLLPRAATDVKGQLALTHTPITKAYIGLDANFKATAKNADSVKLYYKGESDPSYKSIAMITADGQSYNGKILKDNVPNGKFLYYIEAKNSDETKSVGTADKPNEVAVVADNDGPAFTNELPATGDSIDSRFPAISVSLDDPNGVDTSAVTLSIDGTDFTSKAVISETDVKLVLTQDQSLTEGDHTIVVSAKDKLGNSSSKTWLFNVAKRFTGGNHYRGTTHNHTNISHDAAGAPEDALKAAQKYHYDFFAFSDHSHDIDANLVNKDTVDRNGMKERTGGSDWQLTKDLAKQYTQNGKFVVFPAFEMTSTTWGHSNVFGTQNFVDRVVDGGAYQNLQKYYSWALTYDNIVAQFNHPAMSANAFDNFIPYNKNVDKLFTLLEVGNGSGKYSYANAENKFYSALDLGWHVAPTYGEDNHDATWGQTKKRTVIVATDLSQDSLLESMKKMRVYMSEDPNFTLDVSASGFYMGSTVDTNTLDFTVKGSDPVLEKATDPDYSYIKTTSNDAIAKVELITNHGTVVQTYKPTDDSTSVDWKPDSITVAGGQQWFVVKVTQKDGDQIYSAPIWSPAKELAVNVSDVSTTDGAIVGGVPANLTAGISNQGSVNVSNISAKFYYDSIDADHLIGTSTVDSLASNTSGSASVVWQNPVPGTHNIIVTLSAGDGHDLGANQYSQSFVIKAPLGKTVMIDSTHNNENTTADLGTYKDNLKMFSTLMKQQGYTVVENNTTLSDQVLKNVAVLYITHPASAYTTNEITAINNFVNGGGSLLMTEKSNFGGSNQNENAILSGVGSSILVNNDGVFDETTDGNFWGTPLTSNFSVRLHPKPVKSTLTDFVPTIEYYSGASLAKNDGAGNKVPLSDSNSVTVLVRGNESTFQDSTTIKSDSVSYNVKTSNGKTGPALTDVTGGSAIPMIASEEIGKGRVVVSGMNIFNDKQMDQTYNAKGNDPFAVNVVNWLSHLEPKVSTIGDARKLTEGTNTVVEGTVTATSFFDAAYIQDSTGGIMAFNDVPEGSLKVGDKIRVYGHIKIFENNFELEFGSFADSIVKLGSDTPIEPKVVSTKDSNAEENQGQLIKVKGQVVSKYDDNSYIIDDGTGPTLVFTDGYIVNQSGPVPNLQSGDTLEAIGLAGKFSDGNRIRVRDSRELTGTHISAPVVTGIDNNGIYNHDVPISFDKGTATLNGRDFTSGTVVSDDGTYTLVVTDQNGNATTVNFVVDKTAPAVSGVEDSHYYNQDVPIFFNEGSATLDGADFTNGSAVTDEGDHKLVVTDEAGNKTTVKFTIDKTAPEVKGVDKNALYNQVVTVTFNEGTAVLNDQEFTSGTVVSEDGIYTLVVTDQAGNATTVVFAIDKTAPVVTGVAKESLYNHDVVISFNEGTATLDGDEFTNGATVSKEGSHTLVVTDEAGNKTTVHFTLDKTAPIVSGVKDGFYNHDVNITFDDGTATLNGESFKNGTAVSDEGSYTLTVTDEAGNATVVNFTIDKTAPSVTGVAEGSYYNADVTINFNKGTATLNDEAFTSGTVVSQEGSYTLVVTDQAGNVTTVHFTIDKTAPIVDGVTNNGFYNHEVTLSFNELGGLLNGVPVPSGTVVSKEGTYTLLVSDNAGNVTTVHFTIDKTAPIVSGIDKNAFYNHDVLIKFNEGTATLDNKEFTNGSAVTNEGTHTIVVTDLAGNVTTVNFTIDKTAPNLKVSVDKAILSPPNHKLENIKAAVNSSDALSGIDSAVLESITVNESNATPDDIQGASYGTLDTEFSLRSERNGNGTGRVYTITYLAKDQAGNITRATATVTVPKGNQGN